MSETIIDVTAEKVKLHQVTEKKESFMSEVFGQFIQPAFWRDLAKTLVSEIVSSLLMALGGGLFWYGKERKDKRLGDISNTITNSNVTQKAFGSGGFTPSNTYQPSTPSYNMPSTFNQNNSFPGFPTR